mgnify:CR=1 FL=1|jgi:hypothetical protein|tara:strand:+ start:32343 stop:32696 length:354 start_codon:yes stop_codon:yes gene_type:complete
MRSLIYGVVAAATMATGAMAEANDRVVSDPGADADCLISLMLLMEAADESDEDSLFTIAMYYFGRLGGEGYANKTFLMSRIGRFFDDENLYLTESETCATDFATEGNKLGELFEALE